jgi:murein DD-endopeptidase MepM/ murein hydrolase activator NlpD
LSTKQKHTFWKRLLNKYRLVVMNDDTFEEVTSLRLSRINLFVVLSTLVVTLVGLTVFLLVFTPLREYIPGYGETNSRNEMVKLRIKVDSLEGLVNANSLYIKNVNQIVDGTVGQNKPTSPEKKTANEEYNNLKLGPSAKEDDELRNEMENKEKFLLQKKKPLIDNQNQIVAYSIIKPETRIGNFSFFPPLKGILSSTYLAAANHFGVDIIANKNEPIKSILDGTVIFSDWTMESGYVISIQHSNNIISNYKHNSAIFKKVGNFVKAGEVIAIIGNTGELSNGPHLHFELWFNGLPVNPTEFINFN